jgi:hypothetical protein
MQEAEEFAAARSQNPEPLLNRALQLNRWQFASMGSWLLAILLINHG